MGFKLSVYIVIDTEDIENLESPHRASEIGSEANSRHSHGIKVAVIEGTNRQRVSNFEVATNEGNPPEIQEPSIDETHTEEDDEGVEYEESESDHDEQFEDSKEEPVKMQKKSLQIEVIDFHEDEPESQEHQVDYDDNGRSPLILFLLNQLLIFNF